MPSYLVIAREYRPRLFEEIIGQEHVTRTLRNAISSGRITHAYLFSGPRGVGKTTAARILAKGLNCEKGTTPAPCNSCESCKAISAGTSVDVLEIDGASNTGVENVRELKENIQYLPTNGRFRVYIIDEAHMLSASAFNALLKTLEEPPPHAVFIFATTEVHRIPLTILSRCQRFDFRRIPLKEISSQLGRILKEKGFVFEEGALYAIAREADGSLRDAQSLLDQVLAFSGGEVKAGHVAEALGLMDRSVLFDLLEGAISRDSRRCLNVVEKMHDFGYDFKRASEKLLELVRDLTVIKTAGSELVEMSDHELERAKSLASGCGRERLHMLFSILSRGYEEVSRSAYPRYSFEMALLRAAHFDEVRPLREILERLEKLGGRSGCGEEEGVKGANPGEKEKPPARTEKAPSPARAEEEGGAYSGSPLEYIREKNRPLAGPLEGAVVKAEGNTVHIRTTSENGNFLRIRKDRLESLLGEYYKRPVKVNLVIEEGPAQDNKSSSPEPLVEEVLEVLGGRVVKERRGDVQESR